MNELDVEGFFRALRAIFGSMSETERKVIFLRRGINHTQTPLTLEAVGKQIGVTRERIRQIEAKAEEHIRYIIKDISVLPMQPLPAVDTTYPPNNPNNSLSNPIFDMNAKNEINRLPKKR